MQDGDHLHDEVRLLRVLVATPDSLQRISLLCAARCRLSVAVQDMQEMKAVDDGEVFVISSTGALFVQTRIFLNDPDLTNS